MPNYKNIFKEKK